MNKRLHAFHGRLLKDLLHRLGLDRSVKIPLAATTRFLANNGGYISEKWVSNAKRRYNNVSITTHSIFDYSTTILPAFYSDYFHGLQILKTNIVFIIDGRFLVCFGF